MSDRFDPPVLKRLEMQSALPVGVAGGLRKYHLELDRFRPAVRYAHEAWSATTSSRFTYDFCLSMFVDIKGELLLPRQEVVVDPFTLLIVPPFVLHRFVFPKDRQQHVAVHFDLAPGFPSGNNLEGREPYEVQLGDGVVLPLATKVSARGHLYERLCNIARRMERPSFADQLLADVELGQVLGDAIAIGASAVPVTGTGASVRVKSGVDRAISFMLGELSKELTIEGISGVAQLSPSQLNRGFRGLMGYPCIAYLHRLRMMKARELLRDHDLTVKEVARAVGYADAGRFSKSFRAFDGLSPSEYRGQRAGN